MKIVETYTRPDDVSLPEEHLMSHCTAETFRQLIFDYLEQNLRVNKEYTESGYGRVLELQLRNPHTGQYETIKDW